MNNLYITKLNKNNRYNNTPENTKKSKINLKSRNDNNQLWKSQNYFYSRKSQIINDNVTDNIMKKKNMIILMILILI